MIGPRRASFHEAGHALIATSIAWTVNEVSIRQRGDLAGYCHAAPVERTRDEVQAAVATRTGTAPDYASVPVPNGIALYDSIFYSLGGPAAEQVGLGAFSTEAAESDLQHAMSLVERGLHAKGTAEVSRLIDGALGVVRGRLEDRWDAVERVADALERRGTLSGDDVRGLIAGEPLRSRRLSRQGFRVLAPNLAAPGKAFPALPLLALT